VHAAWCCESVGEISVWISRLKHNNDVPNISLDCIMKVAGLIEHMGRERLGLRSDGDRNAHARRNARDEAKEGAL
jgi:hypothetical protein